MSSVGNLTPGISNGCNILHSGPNSLGRPSITRGSKGALYSESPSSRDCSSICPFDILCSLVLGLSVAVAIGLGGDPPGRKVLTGKVSGSGHSVSTGTEVTGGVSVCDTLAVVVTGTSVTLLPSVTVLKKHLVAA